MCCFVLEAAALSGSPWSEICLGEALHQRYSRKRHLVDTRMHGRNCLVLSPFLAALHSPSYSKHSKLPKKPVIFLTLSRSQDSNAGERRGKDLGVDGATLYSENINRLGVVGDS